MVAGPPETAELAQRGFGGGAPSTPPPTLTSHYWLLQQGLQLRLNTRQHLRRVLATKD